ncbi:hypothetical protein D3C73_1177030 [compost metagenome]
MDYPFEAHEKGFEDVILNGSDENALRRYAMSIVDAEEWPEYLKSLKPSATMQLSEIKKSLREYFTKSKATGLTADFLGQCSMGEMPDFIVSTLQNIQERVETQITFVDIIEDSSEDYLM